MRFLSNKKTLLFLGLINLLFIGAIAYTKGDIEILDSKFFYLKSDVNLLLTSLGDEGRATYIKINFLDFGFIISYLLFFVGLYFSFFKETATILIIIPILLALADFSETFSIFYLLKNFPSQHDLLEYFLMFITPTKWILALSSFLVIVNGYFVNLYIKKT